MPSLVIEIICKLIPFFRIKPTVRTNPSCFSLDRVEYKAVEDIRISKRTTTNTPSSLLQSVLQAFIDPFPRQTRVSLKTRYSSCIGWFCVERQIDEYESYKLYYYISHLYHPCATRLLLTNSVCSTFIS